MISAHLRALCDFTRHPLRWFFRHGLRLPLPTEGSAAEPDREPLELSHLERWEAGKLALAAAVVGEAEFAEAHLTQTGALPPGALGRSAYGGIAAEVAGLLQQSALQRAGPTREALDFDLELAGVRVWAPRDG